MPSKPALATPAAGWACADGADVMSEIGTDAMADAIVEAARRKDIDDDRLGQVAEYIRDNRRQTQPEEYFDAVRYLNASKGEPIEPIRAGDLKVGDTVKVDGEEFAVTAKDRGLVTLKDGDTVTVSANAMLAAGWLMKSRSLAARTLPDVATATKTSIWRGLNDCIRTFYT